MRMHCNYQNQVPGRNSQFQPRPVYVIEEADSTTNDSTAQVLKIAIALAVLIVIIVTILVIARSI